MKDYQRDFLQFALQQGVLKFGEFTLKSGRVSPYFFNAGLFNTGESLYRLGGYYARAIVDSGIDFNLLFGPAYKGIPLVSAASSALFEQHQRNVGYCFNRKEAKDHGEGGSLVGTEMRGRVLIIDDVITAGTAIRESMQIIAAHHATAAGVVIALDRMERGQGEQSAVQEVESNYGIGVIHIASFNDLVEYLEESGEHAQHMNAMQVYAEEYGTGS